MPEKYHSQSEEFKVKPEQPILNSTLSYSQTQLHSTQSHTNQQTLEPSDWFITGYSPTEIIMATSFLVTAIAGGITGVIKAIASLNISR